MSEPAARHTLEAPDGPTAVARPAGDGAFVCQGDRSTVTGTDRSGVQTIALDGRALVAGLTTAWGPCGNVLALPSHVRRELLGPGGTLLEDVLALPRLPGVVVQWLGVGATDEELEVTWSVLSSGIPHQEGDRLEFSADEEPEPLIGFRLVPEPTKWQVERAGAREWSVRVRVRLGAGEPVTWAAGASEKPMVAEAPLRQMEALGPQEAVAAGWLRDLARDHVRLRTDVHDIDAGLEWAKARASGLSLDEPGLSRIRAQLLCGLMREARETLSALEGSPDFGAGLAEYLLFVGDYDAPAALRRPLAGWTEWRSRQSNEDATVDTRLAEALEGLGYPDPAEAVRRAASDAPRAKTVGGGVVALPMAGAPAVDASAIPDRDPDALWLHFRELSTRAARGAADLSPHGPSIEAFYELPITLMSGLLGLDGEAALGRLVLEPCLPEHLDRLAVEGIRLGKGGVDLLYERPGGRHRFVLRPTYGALPINVIFKPRLPGTRLLDAWVDGEPAMLEWDRVGQRATPRLQFPVERERTVELEIASDPE